jgi:hypothetical protein
MFLFFIVIEIERIGGPDMWTPHFRSTSKAQSAYRGLSLVWTQIKFESKFRDKNTPFWKIRVPE